MGVKIREKLKDSGVWGVFINHHGRRVSRQVGSKAAAKKAADQIQAKLTLGKEALPKAKPKAPTLEEYYEHIRKTYLETATRPKTQASYQSSFDTHILPRLGSRSLDEITKADVRNLIVGLVDAGKARSSIRLMIGQLRAVLGHAVEDGLITQNPATKCSKFYAQAPGRQEIEPLNSEEVGLFLQAVWNRRVSRKHFPLFLCAIHTGMRSAELAGLQWGDIDFRGRFLTVRRSYVLGRVQPTKTGKNRRVDLSDTLLEALREHRRVKRQELLRKGLNKLPDWVFANERGGPPQMGNLAKDHFKKCLDVAGLRTIRFHDLRHSYASLLIQNGEPLAYIRDQLGHSSISITVDVYGHLEPGANRNAVNRLPTLESVPVEDANRVSAIS